MKKKQEPIRKRGAEFRQAKRSEEVVVENREEVSFRLRIAVSAVIFCLFWLILWCRAWYLQVFAAQALAAKASEQHEFIEQVRGRRGMILDRNGQVMARSVEAHSVYATPAKIQDKRACANFIGPLLGMQPQVLFDKLNTTRAPFIWLKRKVDDYTAGKIDEAKITGIGLKTEYTRVYPFKHMAGQ
ncbi:MAG: hypothetical protein IK079_01860, partial [Desulfovibrio sp.]|nr:hypothetical protein [Desulfovibrio sp.]